MGKKKGISGVIIFLIKKTYFKMKNSELKPCLEDDLVSKVLSTQAWGLSSNPQNLYKEQSRAEQPMPLFTQECGCEPGRVPGVCWMARQSSQSSELRVQ